MTYEPECSIVMSSYNQGRFLTEGIESALAAGADEVVVVDDGSTDNSWNIIAAYGDRLKAIRQRNQGQAAAINTGIEAARGRLILLLDGDDLAGATRVARIGEVFRSTQAQWVRHDMLFFDERGTDGLAYRFEQRSAPRRELEATGRVRGSTSGLAFRSSFLRALGPIPEDAFRYNPDFYLAAAAAIAGECVTLCEPLTLRRVHAQQFSRRLSVERSLMLGEALQRMSMARHARDLAERFGTVPTVGRGETWWQQKWTSDYERLHGGGAGRLRTWGRQMKALARAPLPSSRKAAEAARSTLLGITPAVLFPRMWWATHNGRSGLAALVGRSLTTAPARPLTARSR